MSNTIKPIKQKDALYYRDLIYYLRYLAKLDFEPNEETDARIRERENTKEESVTIKIKNEEITVLNESVFTLELFSIVAAITVNAGVKFGSLHGISKYPEIVKKTIEDLESQIAELEKGSTLSLKRKPEQQ